MKNSLTIPTLAALCMAMLTPAWAGRMDDAFLSRQQTLRASGNDHYGYSVVDRLDALHDAVTALLLRGEYYDEDIGHLESPLGYLIAFERNMLRSHAGRDRRRAKIRADNKIILAGEVLDEGNTSGLFIEELFDRAAQILSPDDQHILELFLDGNTYRDIAAATGKSAPTVSRIMTGRVYKAIQTAHEELV